MKKADPFFRSLKLTLSALGFSLALIGPVAWAGQCALSLPAGGNVSRNQICATALDENSCGRDPSFEKAKRYLADTTVIGIPGYHNETGTQDYFDMLKKTTEAGDGQFVMVRTNSSRTVEVDAPFVCQGVEEAISSGKRNVVIVAHSKGGATAQYFSYACPEVFSKVTAVVLVNAVLHGSFYADEAVNTNAASRFGAAALQKLNQVTNIFGDEAAGASLSSKVSEARLNQARQRGANPAKTFCVRTWASAGGYGPFEKYGSTRTGVQNDGLVDFAAQSDSDVGLCTDLLAVSDANHASFVERGSNSNVTPACRQAFAGYLLNLVRLKTGH